MRISEGKATPAIMEQSQNWLTAKQVQTKIVQR